MRGAPLVTPATAACGWCGPVTTLLFRSTAPVKPPLISFRPRLPSTFENVAKQRVRAAPRNSPARTDDLWRRSGRVIAGSVQDPLGRRGPSGAAARPSGSRGARRHSSRARRCVWSTLNVGIRAVEGNRRRLAFALVVDEIVRAIPSERSAVGPVEPLVRVGSTRCWTKSSALNRALRKLAEKLPVVVLVPDLVTAFTSTPFDRPCDASHRLATNWNSPTASCDTRGFCAPARPLLVTCWPSILSWKSKRFRAVGEVRIRAVRSVARRQQ